MWVNANRLVSTNTRCHLRIMPPKKHLCTCKPTKSTIKASTYPPAPAVRSWEYRYDILCPSVNSSICEVDGSNAQLQHTDTLLLLSRLQLFAPHAVQPRCLLVGIAPACTPNDKFQIHLFTITACYVTKRGRSTASTCTAFFVGREKTAAIMFPLDVDLP